MIRGALIGLLHEHALEARGAGDDDGRVVTLMSNDVGNLENSGEMVHETWARFSEVVIGTYLLSRQVGWLWPVPIVFIFGELLAPTPTLLFLSPPPMRAPFVVSIRNSPFNASMLSSQPPRREEPQARARQMECGHAASYIGDKLHAGGYEEHQDARDTTANGISHRRPPPARDGCGLGSQVADVWVQR